jgi:carbamate kinase
MINADYNIVITHGNGPQVGFSLIRSDIASNVLLIVPMDACGADTQETIGYMMQQSLYNKFKVKNINKKVVTIVTQVKIDKGDPAFKNLTKLQLALFILKKKLRNYKKKKVGLSLKIQVEDVEE